MTQVVDVVREISASSWVGRCAAADHDHVPARELPRGAVVDGVQLTAAEQLLPRVVRDEGAGPGAGGVDDRPRRPVAAVGAHEEPVVSGAGHGRDPHRAVDRQGEAPLVLGEVGGHGVRGAQVVGGRLERQARQLVHAVGGAHGQRRPAVLPRTAGVRVGVEDDEAGLRFEPLPGQGPGGAEPGLTRADDDDVDRAGAAHTR